MTASILICTRNRCRFLADTLRSLHAVAVPDGLKAEIIVIDNGSTDETRAVISEARMEHISLRYINEPRRGLSHARNTGLGAARGQVIVFTDDDVRPESQWLKRIIQPIVEDRFDVVAGRVAMAPHLMRSWMTGQHRAWLATTDYLNQIHPEIVVGANMGFSRRVLECVPEFDPELGSGRLGFYEDTLFSLQLKRAGYRFGMVVDAVVEHHFDVSRLSRSSFLARARGEGQSLAYVAWHWKHKDLAFPAMRAAGRELELYIKRIVRHRECRQPEGMPVWEMKLVSRIEFLRQFQKVKREPRAYEQYGTRKLRPPK